MPTRVKNGFKGVLSQKDAQEEATQALRAAELRAWETDPKIRCPRVALLTICWFVIRYSSRPCLFPAAIKN